MWGKVRKPLQSVQINHGYHYMHIWLVEALSLILPKANFSLQQRNIFYVTTKFVEIIEKVTPTQIPIKSIIFNTIQIN